MKTFSTTWPNMGEMATVDYLKERGYTLTADGKWNPPSINHQPTCGELAAIDYLETNFGFNNIVLKVIL